MKRWRSLIRLAGLMLLAPPPSQAQAGYSIQSLVKAGDTIAGVPLAPSNEPDFQIVGLNDNGEMVFYALNTAGQRVLFDYNGGKFTRIAGEGDTVGGVLLAHFQGGGGGPTFNGQTTFLGSDAGGNDLLFQYAAGKTTLIAAPGMPAPGGHFGTGSYWGITKPVSMNWQGNVVFQAYLSPTTPYPPGIRNPTQPAVFLWNAVKQQLTTVAGPGTKLGDLTILSAASGDPPAINNNGEMVVNISGTLSAAPYYFQGLLFIGADGRTQPIVQFGQKLPDGSTSSGGSHPILNDAGVVAFAPRPGAADAYYLWDKDTRIIGGPIVAVGEDAWGDGAVAQVEAFDLDPISASGIFQVRLDDPYSGPRAVYQFVTIGIEPGTQVAPAASARRHGDSKSPTPTTIRRTVVPKGKDDPHKNRGLRRKSRASSPIQPPLPPDQQKKFDKDQQDLQNDAAKIIELAGQRNETTDPNQRSKIDKQISDIQTDQQKIDTDMQKIMSDQYQGSQGSQSTQTHDARPGPFYTLTSPSLDLAVAADSAGEAYWIGADGQLALLLRDGIGTDVGLIRQVWVYSEEFGEAAWDSFHQVALRANIADAGGNHDAILLLTPTSAP